MPKLHDVDKPEGLRPYLFHGVELDQKNDEKNVVGECPFCSRHKFSVHSETSEFRCFVCGEQGNARIFIRKLHALSMEATTEEDYEKFASHRKLMRWETLQKWGVCKSVITGCWLIPGYDADWKMNQLYAYLQQKDGMRLLPTPTLGHQIHGPVRQNSCENIYLCEGPWDGMAIYEILSFTKETDSGDFLVTGNPEQSLLKQFSVYAVPGCNTFLEGWSPLFEGKCVGVLYDSDHPRTANNKPVAPAGLSGVKRVTKLLGSKETEYLHWGDKGYDPKLPDGTDVRDVLSENGITNPSDRVIKYKWILERIRPVPEDWLKGRTKKAKAETPDLVPMPCTNYKELQSAWKKALKWTEGLDYALSVMLASIASTESVGDQLWVKVVGPASCGKSTLCEAVSVSKKYVYPKSTIRGFHSGYSESMGKDPNEDHSLISKAKGKTLVTKDGDTLLQSPNLGQILSEARDVYDTVSRTSYRTKASRDYEGVRITWILCGTASLRQLDSSELGQRFLDCVIMDGIDDELEDEILWRVANKAEKNLSIKADGGTSTQYAPELATAMQLTGGYVEYLRENAVDLLSTISSGDDALHLCTRLGKYVALMRARPSNSQDETIEREFAARLVSQHVRVAKCLALVLNKKTIDEEVISRTRKIALDTARGNTAEIAKYLYRAGETGLETRAVSTYTNLTEDKARRFLRFLRHIEVVELHGKQSVKGLTSRPKWRLTQKMTRLYHEVTGEVQDE